MTYVDGFVIPIATDKVEEYRKMSAEAGEVWLKYGALSYKECVADDVSSEFTKDAFPKMAGTKEGETVIFSFITYKSREHRDEVNAKVFQDPVIQISCAKNAPFDMNRMAYGGFKAIVDL